MNHRTEAVRVSWTETKSRRTEKTRDVENQPDRNMHENNGFEAGARRTYQARRAMRWNMSVREAGCLDGKLSVENGDNVWSASVQDTRPDLRVPQRLRSINTAIKASIIALRNRTTYY